MSKGSIKDPSIAIQPSEKLVDFIKTLSDPSIALPENLLRAYQGFTSNTKERKIDREPVPQLPPTADEEKLLRNVHSESTVELGECLKNLALSVAEDTEDSDGSISDHGADTNKKKTGSKSEARRERAKKKEKERSELTLNLNDLRWIDRYLTKQRQSDEGVGYLHELLGGSKLVLPQNEIVERNPELEARCQRLRREQDERNYKSMTKNVDCSRTHAPDDTISYQSGWINWSSPYRFASWIFWISFSVKQINRQLIAVMQFICSVLAGFAFGFVGIDLTIGNLDFGFRLLLGIICALIVALAEIYFLAKKLNEDIDYEEAHQHWLKSKSQVPSSVDDSKAGAKRPVAGKEHAD